MPPQTTTGNSLDPQVVALAQAVRQSESGGDPTISGKSGEYGAYQYEPGTWAKQSAAAGVNVPLKQASLQQQNQVWYTWAKSMKDQGYNPGEIASMQNAGTGEPSAYTGKFSNGAPSEGTNAEGVKYSVPDYVNGVMKNYQQYKSQGLQQAPTSTDVSQQTPAMQPPTQQPSSGVTADALQSQGTSDGVNANTLSGDTGNPFAQYANSSPMPASAGEDTSTLGEQASKRLGDASNALSQAATGQINPLSGLLQTAGAAGGFVGDVTNDALKLIPGVSQAEGLLGQGVGALAKTGIGKQVVGAGENFAQAHPELSADIGAVGNIASAIPVFKGVGLLKDAAGSALSGVGKDAIVDAISPEIKAGTKAGAADVARNGTVKSGLLGNVSRVADPQMVEAAPVVEKNIPNFMKLGTNSEKLAAVEETAIPQEAQALRESLMKPDIQNIVNPDNYKNFVDSINSEIETSPSLIGNSGEYAKRFLAVFQRNLPQGVDATALDVLDARQALDKEALNYKPKVFDAASANAYSDGLYAVRSAANKLIADMAPDAKVLESLRRQSLLYKVAKNLATKSDKEVGTNGLMRAAARHPKVMKAAKYAAGSVATGLGLGEAQHLLGSNQ